MDSLRLVPLGDDDPDRTETFYRQLQAALVLEPTEPLVIDLSPTSFVGPDGLMVLVTAARFWHRQTGQPTILVQMRPDVHKYLDRMDIFTTCGEWIQAAEPLDPRERWARSHSPRKLLEVMPIAAAVDQNARDVIDAVSRAQRILVTWFGSDQRAVGPIVTVLSEIASNVAHSRDRGFAAIQHHHAPGGPVSGGRVTIVVADLGVGIEMSLRRKRAYLGLSPHEPMPVGSAAILRALELGVTSRDKVGGMGLYLVKTIVDRWQGSLAIRSRRSRVRISGGQVYVKDDLIEVPGTQVTITVQGAVGDELSF